MVMEPKYFKLPSSEPTNPTLGKGTSSSTVPWKGDDVSSQQGILMSAMMFPIPRPETSKGTFHLKIFTLED